MGFYIKKSIGFGPLRFNLSNAGIGVSSGFPGFRVGTTSRGTYIHIGQGGLYYKQTLSNNDANSLRSIHRPAQTISSPSNTHGPMTLIGSGSVDRMVDTNSVALLSEIARKRKQWTIFPFTFVISLTMTAVLVVYQVPLGITIPLLALMILLLLAIFQFDRINKSLVLMYDLDETSSQGFKCLCDAFDEMRRCAAIWHIKGQAAVYNAKYHAGASQLSDRSRVSFRFRDPPLIKTNVSVPCLPLGRNSMYLLPDRILFLTREGVGAIPYSEVRLSGMEARFIEEGFVPRDSTIVDTTFRFVNKDGSPDRRFKDNRSIPICQYEELRITSPSGLEEAVQLSRFGASKPFASAISQWVSVIRVAETTERQRQKHDAHRTAFTSPPYGSVAHDAATEAHAIHIALFEICCTVMIADGKASHSEKEKIRNVMSRANAQWSNKEFDDRVQTFIQTVLTNGYSAIVKRSLSQLSQFKTPNQKNVLLKCIDLVASADGTLAPREKALCEQIRRELQ